MPLLNGEKNTTCFWNLHYKTNCCQANHIPNTWVTMRLLLPPCLLADTATSWFLKPHCHSSRALFFNDPSGGMLFAYLVRGEVCICLQVKFSAPWLLLFPGCLGSFGWWGVQIGVLSGSWLILPVNFLRWILISVRDFIALTATLILFLQLV